MKIALLVKAPTLPTLPRTALPASAWGAEAAKVAANEATAIETNHAFWSAGLEAPAGRRPMRQTVAYSTHRTRQAVAWQKLITEDAPASVLVDVLGDINGTMNAVCPTDRWADGEFEQMVQAAFSDHAEACAQVENIHDAARAVFHVAVVKLAEAAGFGWVTL